MSQCDRLLSISLSKIISLGDTDLIEGISLLNEIKNPIYLKRFITVSSIRMCFK